MRTITIAEDGTMTLGDGRVVYTTAATSFFLNMNEVTLDGGMPVDQPRYSEQCRRFRRFTWATILETLYDGGTVALRGMAEGRLLDGTVQTTNTLWCVCAL